MKRNDLLAKSLTLGLAVATAAASMSVPGGLAAPQTVYAEEAQQATAKVENKDVTFTLMDETVYKIYEQTFGTAGQYMPLLSDMLLVQPATGSLATTGGAVSFTNGTASYFEGFGQNPNQFDKKKNGLFLAWQAKFDESVADVVSGSGVKIYMQSHSKDGDENTVTIGGIQYKQYDSKYLYKLSDGSVCFPSFNRLDDFASDQTVALIIDYTGKGVIGNSNDNKTVDYDEMLSYKLDFNGLTKKQATPKAATEVAAVVNTERTGYTLTVTPSAILTTTPSAIGATLQYSVSGTEDDWKTDEEIKKKVFTASDNVEKLYTRWGEATSNGAVYKASDATEATIVAPVSATPTITNAGKKVTIQAASATAIYYTTDGTAPATTVSGDAIVASGSTIKANGETASVDVSNGTIVKAIALETDKILSAVAEKTITISSGSTGGYTGGGGSSSSSSSSTTTDTSKKDETSKTETKPDGSTVTTTETKNNDGSTTTKTETTKKDGSTETKTETKKNDGSTETKTETKKTDGSTETKTEVKKMDGSTESKTEIKKTDGSTEKKTEVKKADGSSEKTTETVKADGSSTSKKVIKEEGTKVVVNTEKDADGDTISVKANVQTVSEDDSASILAEMVEKLVEEAGTTDLNISQRIYDSEGKTICKVNVNASDLKAGKKLKVFKIDSETGELTVVNNETYKVDKDGNVSFDGLQKANYQVMTASEASKYVKEVLSTVKPENSKKTVTEGKKTKFKLDDGLNMGNVKGITYKTSKKSVATVDKNGNITTKKSGKVVVKATVTLKNGKKKTVKMVINVTASK